MLCGFRKFVGYKSPFLSICFVNELGVKHGERLFSDTQVGVRVRLPLSFELWNFRSRVLSLPGAKVL